MFLVNKITYAEYITDDSKLLNGSVRSETRLSETLLPNTLVLYWGSCCRPEMRESARTVHVIS